MSDSLEAARVRILVDNTAQAVFKHLERLEDVREKLGARWVWELLQNARDAATPQGLSVEITLSSGQLLFRHDGGSFSEDEIAHLIYHGSTKVTENEADLVHFGSGLLSTHLPSRCVTVTGCLSNDSRSRVFSFVLDRSGDSVEDLNSSMQKTWDEFAESLGSSADLSSPVSTSFVYSLNADGERLAAEGLDQLERFVTPVLAFSPEIRALAVHTPARSWEVTRAERSEADGVALQSFRIVRDDDVLVRVVALAGDDVVQAATPLRPSDEGLVTDLPSSTPRLFIVFPLLTTERLGLPTIVHSKQFSPLEDRDGIPLDGESSRIADNRQLLDRSSRFAQTLLERAASDEWGGSESLVLYDTSSLPDWVDSDWFRGHLRRHLRYSRTLALVETLAGGRIPPEDAWIPSANSDQGREELWELAAGLHDASGRLPAHQHLNAWATNLASWMNLADEPASLPEAFPVRRLAAIVGKVGSVDALSRELDAPDVVGWLARLSRLVRAEGDSDLFDTLALLPSQAGLLHRRADLALDPGIADDLKDISERLGLDLRDRLLDQRIAAQDLADLFSPLAEASAVEEVLSHHAGLAKDGRLPEQDLPPSAALFWWLASSTEHRGRLEGFPVGSAEEGESGCTLLALEPGSDRAPMAPVAAWNEAARQHAGLFPRRRILNDAYALALAETDWGLLTQSGLVTLDPIVTRRRTLRCFVSQTDVVEADEDDDSHRTVDPVDVSEIAFLEEPDIGLIDAARRSRSRALELLRFVVDYAAVHDASAFEEVPRACECGETHLAFRANWLIPLRRRKWIPAVDGSRRAVNVSAETLAELIRHDPELVQLMATDIGDKVLAAWGVSTSDLQLRVVADDEQTRKVLVVTIGDLARATGSVERLQTIAREIADHPELIGQIEAQRETRARVERNARIGELVENLLRDELSAAGLSVRRTGVGSDFEVDSDFVVDGQQVLIEITGEARVSTLLEVKSARGSHVRMTPAQAEHAQVAEHFCLCVVELADDNPTLSSVRDSSRFVFDIGHRLSSAWTDYTRYRDATSNVRRSRGEVGVEVAEGQVRFRVDQQVWVRGSDFSDALDGFRRADS